MDIVVDTRTSIWQDCIIADIRLGIWEVIKHPQYHHALQNLSQYVINTQSTTIRVGIMRRKYNL